MSAPEASGVAPRRRLGRLVLPVAAAIATYVLWGTPVVYPLKLFVVFLHELSHGLAAIATGGSIDHIELGSNEGGLCVTRGGARFVVLSAGYLGSLLWGAFLLVFGARSRHDRGLVGLMGVVTMVVTLLWVRSAFGFAYGIVAGVVLLLVATRMREGVADVLVQVVGVVSCLYAVWDIASDLILRDVPGSDANALGQLTGIPGVMWGVAWAAVALVVCAWALRAAAGGSAEVD